jgi:amino acid permease
VELHRNKTAKNTIGALCVLGGLLFALPYWLSLLGTVVLCLSVAPFLIVRGFQDKELPGWRKWAFVILGVALLVVEVDLVLMIINRALQEGWLGHFR